jgi:hypothetical protein
MDELKKYIEMLIKQQSAKDADFKALLSKPNKSVDECAKYLQGEAYKEAKKGKGTCRCVGWSDESMTGQIIHYYQEDSIKVEQLPSNVSTEQPKQKQPKQEERTTTVAKEIKLKRKVTIKKKESKNPKCQELSLF